MLQNELFELFKAKGFAINLNLETTEHFPCSRNLPIWYIGTGTRYVNLNRLVEKNYFILI